MRSQGSSKYTLAAIILQQALMDKNESDENKSVKDGLYTFSAAMRRMREN